jgi:hypothetical protein
VVVEAISLTAGSGLSLAAGEWVQIDTRPAGQRPTFVVLQSNGQTQASKLTATSSLWWLVPGENRFSIQVTGATGATLVTLTYRDRYLGLLR